MSKPPELFALFCEDVRRELGGTQSIIGVFQDVVLLEEMPFTLPRLSVFFNLHLFDADLDKVCVELQRADTGVVLTSVAFNDINGLKKRLEAIGDQISEVGVKVNGTIESTSFSVEEPMTLRICAHLNRSRSVVSSSRLTFRLAKDAKQ